MSLYSNTLYSIPCSACNGTGRVSVLKQSLMFFEVCKDCKGSGMVIE